VTGWDYDLRRVTGRHGMVVVQPLVADALFVLIEQAGRLVTRERLLLRLHGQDGDQPMERSLDVVIHRLRCAFRRAGAAWAVTTVSRSGWVLEGLPEGKLDPKTGKLA
jgi:DNA-binding response OmpR family regulator